MNGDAATPSLAERVSAILVTYNSAAVVCEALDSIAQLSTIYLVDNASSDQTCELIAERYPTVKLLRNQRNLGFGMANNRAAALAETEFMLLLNPDARLEAGALAQLVEAADRYPEAAILAPALVDETGQPRVILCHPFLRRHKIKAPFEQRWIAGELCAEMLSGAVMLVRRRMFMNEDLFDPVLFLYYEDDDLCLRARARGHTLMVIPTAIAFHGNGRSSAPSLKLTGLKQRESMASELYLISKYRGRLATLGKMTGWLLRNLLNIPFYLLIGQPRRAHRSLNKLAGVLLFLQRWIGRCRAGDKVTA